MNEPEDLSKVSSDEVAATFSMAAPFVNRVIVNAAGPNFRISFLERAPDGKGGLVTSARAAVAMHVDDAIALRDVLTGIVEAMQASERRG